MNELMEARRAVKQAKAAGDQNAEAAAHRLVDEAKRSVGERGPVWWNDGHRISIGTRSRTLRTPRSGGELVLKDPIGIVERRIGQRGQHGLQAMRQSRFSRHGRTGCDGRVGTSMHPEFRPTSEGFGAKATVCCEAAKLCRASPTERARREMRPGAEPERYRRPRPSRRPGPRPAPQT